MTLGSVEELRLGQLGLKERPEVSPRADLHDQIKELAPDKVTVYRRSLAAYLPRVMVADPADFLRRFLDEVLDPQIHDLDQERSRIHGLLRRAKLGQLDDNAARWMLRWLGIEHELLKEPGVARKLCPVVGEAHRWRGTARAIGLVMKALVQVKVEVEWSTPTRRLVSRSSSENSEEPTQKIKISADRQSSPPTAPRPKNFFLVGQSQYWLIITANESDPIKRAAEFTHHYFGPASAQMKLEFEK